MARAKKVEEIKMGAPDWVVTFADLMSLLLTFFVLLLSFSSMEVDKFNAVTGSIRSAFGMKSPLDILNRVTSREMKPYKVPSEKKEMRSQQRTVMVATRQALEKADLGEQGKIETDGKSLKVEIRGDAAFQSGSSELTENAKRFLDELAEVLRTEPGEVEVEGHTDDVPIRSSRYPSNWELSTGRAGAALRHLQQQGVPANRMRASGFADTRPVAPNDSAKNRAENRRVVFVLKQPE